MEEVRVQSCSDRKKPTGTGHYLELEQALLHQR